MTKFQENATNVKTVGDQLEGLKREHPISQQKEVFNKNISTLSFSRIEKGEYQVLLKKVYRKDIEGQWRRVSDNYTAPFLVRLYHMGFIECSGNGTIRFTNEGKHILDTFKLLVIMGLVQRGRQGSIKFTPEGKRLFAAFKKQNQF